MVTPGPSSGTRIIDCCLWLSAGGSVEGEAVVDMRRAVRRRHKQVPQSFRARFLLQLLDNRKHLPALARALLRVIIGRARPHLFVHESANPVAPSGLAGAKAEIHRRGLSARVSIGYVPAMQRLAGKVAIVTGAASGIGKATVELFRSEGATVVGADAAKGADEQSDAGSEEAVRALIDQVVKQHGGLDIFFANAGVSGGFATIAEQTERDWAEILRVNLIGPFLAIKYAGPVIAKRGGGSIICT